MHHAHVHTEQGKSKANMVQCKIWRMQQQGVREFFVLCLQGLRKSDTTETMSNKKN